METCRRAVSFLLYGNIMITLLAKKLIPNYKDTDDLNVRRAYGMLAGLTGIVLNLLLFIVKFWCAHRAHSVSMSADAFNNLSDAGGSIVMLCGFALAGKAADRNHPYGHGRMEYLAGLFVSFSIMLMGFELARTSADRILHPQKTLFRADLALIMCATVLVKMYMFYYNYRLSETLHSTALRSAAMDSAGDCAATAAVLAGQAVSAVTSLQPDAVLGLLLSVWIIRGGIRSALETASPLLGEAPDASLIEEIEKKVNRADGILGMHDLLVHDYGPGRTIISLHAEVDADMTLLDAHELADGLERQLGEELGVEAVIHIDPVVTAGEKERNMRRWLTGILAEWSPDASIHDLRITGKGDDRTLSFDAVVPYELKRSDEDLVQELKRTIRLREPSLQTDIRLDRR